MSFHVLKTCSRASEMCRYGHRSLVGAMSVCGSLSSRRTSSLAEMYADAQKQQRDHQKPAFRTNSQPATQTISQEGMFYVVPKDDRNQWLHTAFSKEYNAQIKTFNECAIMVRRPALEVMSYIKQANYKHVPQKYLLYGNRGVGKTVTCAHVMHSCSADGWMVLHFPWPLNWNNRFKEISPSSHNSTRVDLPVESIEWLKSFRRMNNAVLETHQPTTKFNYEWSKRESLAEGSSWKDLIEHGISRPKYASDCIGAILKEIRGQSASLPFKTLLVVDGINSFWAPTKLKDEQHKNVPIQNYSLVHNLKKMMKNDWSNGAILLTVDMNVKPLEERASYYPAFLLGKEGFQLLDPYIPIHVENYNVKEVSSCIDYYVERNWIQSEKGRREEGRKEMVFLSEGNPYALYNVCASC